MSTDLPALAADAYVYGYPLVVSLDHVRRRAELGPLQPAPFNTFSHSANPAGPDDRFIYINADIMYSIAQIDVSGRPLLLTVPDTDGRYYVLQFIDAWTNNFAYVGQRATGTAGGSFLLTPPGWSQEAPEGVPVIEFPTTVGTIVGRWACDGPDDVPVVHKLQAELKLETYGSRAPRRGVQEAAMVAHELAFFERLRTWIQAFPPVAEDREYQDQFDPLGLLDPGTPYRKCPPDLAHALTEGRDAAEQKIDAILAAGCHTPHVNGWAINYHLFDYNIDHLGLGTINEPGWLIADRAAGYLARSLAAHSDLWGTHGYEMACPMTHVDASGDQLDGRNRYTLTFSSEPPAAFWSVTMYKQPDFYLVRNPIERYAIGDRTPGLVRDSDGSLTLLIQHEQPDDTANWLPAPPTSFRLILRMYQPGSEVLAGSYELPPVERLSLRSSAGRRAGGAARRPPAAPTLRPRPRACRARARARARHFTVWASAGATWGV